MKNFTLELSTGNSAFDDDPVQEVVRLLRWAAAELEVRGGIPDRRCPLYDQNGNVVGHYIHK